MRSLRIAVLNPFGYGLLNPASIDRGARVFGGAEVQLRYLATGLARDARFEVSEIAERPPGAIEAEADGVSLVTARPVGARLAHARGCLPVPWPPYWAAMEVADADVYVQRGGAVLTGEVAAFCRVRRRRFVFIAAHDWDCDGHHLRGRGSLAGRFYAWGLHRADLVMAQSRWQVGQLAEHHGIEARLLRNGFPDASPGAPERGHVLWVGRCVAWKRPLAFLALAEQFPEVPFVALCPPYGEDLNLEAAIRAQAEKLPNVTLHGFVPFEQTHRFFTEALAFVNTSEAEGFPNTFVQAGRAATPVVSWKVDPDGHLAAGRGGLYADGDEARLAAQLGRLLTDEPLRRRLAALARERFEREHELSGRVGELAEAVLAVAGRTGTSASSSLSVEG